MMDANPALAEVGPKIKPCPPVSTAAPLTTAPGLGLREKGHLHGLENRGVPYWLPRMYMVENGRRE